MVSGFKFATQGSTHLMRLKKKKITGQDSQLSGAQIEDLDLPPKPPASVYCT